MKKYSMTLITIVLLIALFSCDPGDRPDPITGFQITDVTSTTISLSWDPVGRASELELSWSQFYEYPDGVYSAYYDGSDVESFGVVTLESDVTEYTVTDLDSNATYGFSLDAWPINPGTPETTIPILIETTLPAE